jgi:hypothetical protein
MLHFGNMGQDTQNDKIEWISIFIFFLFFSYEKIIGEQKE